MGNHTENYGASQVKKRWALGRVLLTMMMAMRCVRTAVSDYPSGEVRRWGANEPASLRMVTRWPSRPPLPPFRLLATVRNSSLYLIPIATHDQ